MQGKGVIGVLGAMESEVSGLTGAMEVERSGAGAGFAWWQGMLAGRHCVVARCGMGKVSAAAGVQRLIDAFAISSMVVCGLAGGLQQGLEAGDIVVGERLIQYDVDASPIFPRYQIPGMGVDYFAADTDMVEAADAACRAFLSSQGRPPAARSAKVQRGLIVTGDQFVKDEGRARLKEAFPEAMCVEMEGGAVAQVCSLNNVPFVIVRIVSDNADGNAAVDFMEFVNQQAPVYTVSIVRELLPRLP